MLRVLAAAGKSRGSAAAIEPEAGRAEAAGLQNISLLFRVSSCSMPPRGTIVPWSSNPLKEPHHGRKCQTRNEE